MRYHQAFLLYALAIIGTSAFAGKSKIFDFKHCAKQEDNKDIAMVRNYSQHETAPSIIYTFFAG